MGHASISIGSKGSSVVFEASEWGDELYDPPNEQCVTLWGMVVCICSFMSLSLPLRPTRVVMPTALGCRYE